MFPVTATTTFCPDTLYVRRISQNSLLEWRKEEANNPVKARARGPPAGPRASLDRGPRGHRGDLGGEKAKGLTKSATRSARPPTSLRRKTPPPPPRLYLPFPVRGLGRSPLVQRLHGEPGPLAQGSLLEMEEGGVPPRLRTGLLGQRDQTPRS